MSSASSLTNLTINKTPTVASGLLLTAVILIGLSTLLHSTHIKLPVITLALAFILWRITAIKVPTILPKNRWLLYLLTFLGFVLASRYYGAPLGRDPGVAYLTILTGLKCLEAHTPRDIRIVILLGLFTIITHFLYPDGMSRILPLGLIVITLFWLLTQLEHQTPTRKAALRDLKLTGKMLLQALPFVIILFYLFPRISGSLFLFQQNSTSQTGMSNSLEMGTISNLIQDGGLVFTADFTGVNKDQKVPTPAERYWRGSVFTKTDGKAWSRAREAHAYPQPKINQPQDQTQNYQYNITLEPSKQNWLFSLDHPTTTPKDARRDADNHLYLRRNTNQPYTYTLNSNPAANPKTTSEQELTDALDNGATVITPRLKDFVNQLTKDTTNPQQVAQNLLTHFNQNEYIYTLEPPLLTTNAPADEFLFDSKQGFCEHYASTFTTVMREAGVPTRIVVGYLGGEHNPRTNQLTITQAEAHAWTEIWTDDQGWIRVDPTAAIAPERIRNSINLGSSRNNQGRIIFNPETLEGLQRLAQEFGWLKDAAKFNFNKWFTTFDQDRQKQLLKKLGLENLSFQSLGITAFLVAIGLLTLVSLLLFKKDKTKPNPLKQIYIRYCNKLKKLGTERKPSEGPKDYATRAIQNHPTLKEQINTITNHYIRLQYANVQKIPTQEINQLKTLVKHFKGK